MAPNEKQTKLAYCVSQGTVVPCIILFADRNKVIEGYIVILYLTHACRHGSCITYYIRARLSSHS